MTRLDQFRGARCRTDPELFDEKGGREPEDDFHDRLNRARAICSHCPARQACRQLAHGLEPTGKSGIYAGVEHRWGRATA